MEKKIVRKEISIIRNSLGKKEKEKLDNQIINNLMNTEDFKKAKSIFIYVSFGSEIDTKKIINYSLEKNKKVYVPKTDKIKKTMEAIEINNLNDLITDKWGILEPKEANYKNIGNQFDLIIVPGLAFDLEGNRIGYGGGYYDKYISNLKYNCIKIALTYQFQVIKGIKSEKYDIKIQKIITENGVFVV